jgi:hypothetical protein
VAIGTPTLPSGPAAEARVAERDGARGWDCVCGRDGVRSGWAVLASAFGLDRLGLERFEGDFARLEVARFEVVVGFERDFAPLGLERFELDLVRLELVLPALALDAEAPLLPRPDAPDFDVLRLDVPREFSTATVLLPIEIVGLWRLQMTPRPGFDASAETVLLGLPVTSHGYTSECEIARLPAYSSALRPT